MLKHVLLVPLLSSGSWDGAVGRVQRKTQRCRGTEQPLAGWEKLGVIQAPGWANAPPSGLEGGVGKQTDSLLSASSQKLPGVELVGGASLRPCL